METDSEKAEYNTHLAAEALGAMGQDVVRAATKAGVVISDNASIGMEVQTFDNRLIATQRLGIAVEQYVAARDAHLACLEDLENRGIAPASHAAYVLLPAQRLSSTLTRFSAISRTASLCSS